LRAYSGSRARRSVKFFIVRSPKVVLLVAVTTLAE
jgi:hypothetical protein